MTPAEMLCGSKLDGGWLVKSSAPKTSSTGGFFSWGYFVEHDDGRKGFLKAIDYVAAFQMKNHAEVLQGLTSAYLFEVSLCQQCSHMSRVAKSLGHGSILTHPTDYTKKVDYLIFELADGDVRRVLDNQNSLDLLFVLKTLHHIAVALSQLHHGQIAHQDLKPSNVLMFDQGTQAKICDLGRAWSSRIPAPHDNYPVAGDQTYSTIEACYDAIPSDSKQRRFGCDLYQLGNLATYLFTRVQTTALIVNNLDMAFRPNSWHGTYQDVLPYLLAAFENALTQLLAALPTVVRDEMVHAILQLCNPDPARRGHPTEYGCQFSLQRYISLFDKLIYRVKTQLL